MYKKSTLLILIIVSTLAFGMSRVVNKSNPAVPKSSMSALVNDTKPVTKSGFFQKLPQKDLFGEKIIYDKKLYLMDVWATWCPPCRMTIPELIALQNKYQNKSFSVIGYSVDSSSKPVYKFLEENKLNYPVAMLSRDELTNFPPVRGIPTMFLVDSSGQILKTYVGYTKKEIISKDVDTYL